MTARQSPPVVRQDCTACGHRCGRTDHWPDHFDYSCRRKVWHLTVDGAIDHVERLGRDRGGEAWIYECPLGAIVHWHVASGRFQGWNRTNGRGKA